MQTIGNYINGQISQASDAPVAPIYDPATGAIIQQVALSTVAQTQAAIQAAQDAFWHWQQTTPLKRARVMFAFKTLLETHQDELARLISQEHGKVFSDAKGEVRRGIEVVEFACGIPHLQKGEHSANVGTGVDSYSMMQPLGVCVGITPFNFPAMVPMWMFPIAIACGNSFVLKPAEKDPSAAIRLAELLTEAGLPEGVFNVVNGDKTAVDVLLTDARVAAVSFVGSTPIAETVYQKACAHGKRVQALGGAKNHMMIMPDADPEQVVNALIGAAYGSAGERCMAVSVAICVGDEVADKLIERLCEEIDQMTVGHGLSTPEPHMGPLVSRAHADKVIGYIEQGVSEGAKLVRDGRTFTAVDGTQGFFVGPTLFDQVQPGMRIHAEEIFGPVLSVVRADSYEAALAIINDHEYGNGTAIFTRDGALARAFCDNVQVGMVGVNVPIPVPMAFHSFGGWKRSIFGPLHVHGQDGVRFYTRMKTVTARWPEQLSQDGASFSMPTMS